MTAEARNGSREGYLCVSGLGSRNSKAQKTMDATGGSAPLRRKRRRDGARGREKSKSKSETPKKCGRESRKKNRRHRWGEALLWIKRLGRRVGARRGVWRSPRRRWASAPSWLSSSSGRMFARVSSRVACPTGSTAFSRPQRHSGSRSSTATSISSRLVTVPPAAASSVAAVAGFGFAIGYFPF